MSSRCQVTGGTVNLGNAVSHSHRRSRRRWSPNIQTKTYFLPSEGRRVKLLVSAKGIKVIEARLRREGQRIGWRTMKFARSSSPENNLLSSLGMSAVDYKDTATLRVFISERGKIRSRRVTGLTVRQQRRVATAIKNACEMALLPYPAPSR